MNKVRIPQRSRADIIKIMFPHAVTFCNDSQKITITLSIGQFHSEHTVEYGTVELVETQGIGLKNYFSRLKNEVMTGLEATIDRKRRALYQR